MTRTEYLYVTYIAADPQRIWDAIVEPEFTRQYWGHENISEWRPGASWEHRDADNGTVRIVGKVQEFTPPRRLVLTWADPADAANPEAHSRVTIELERVTHAERGSGGMVKLTVKHDRLVPGSEMQQGIEEGWPRVLSSLKSFLETGKPLPTWAKATN